MKRWWCMDCRVAVDLNKHGRCESCDSEAVYSDASRDQKQASAVEPGLTNAPLFA